MKHIDSLTNKHHSRVGGGEKENKGGSGRERGGGEGKREKRIREGVGEREGGREERRGFLHLFS